MHTDLFTDILVIISVLMVIIFLRKITGIFPVALRSLFKWKECLHLEYSVRLSRDRNVSYAVLILPFCLLMNRCAVSLPSFMTGLHPILHTVLTILIFFIYLWLRDLTHHVFRPRKIDPLVLTASKHIFRSTFVIAVPFLLAVFGILSLTKLSANITNVVILDVTVLFYFLYLLRKWEILVHNCTVLTTFLYICALEIPPALVLAIMWVF